MLNLPKNIENICRLCLTVSDGTDMLPLFPVRGGNPYAPNTVVTKILHCTSVKIEHFDGAPATICELCNTRLEDWHAFREQCMGTDEYLKANYRHIFFPSEVSHFPVEDKSIVNQNSANNSYFLTEDDGSMVASEVNSSHLQEDDGYYENSYDDGEEITDSAASLVQEMNRGRRIPKWSREFGAKLNSLLHVVGGERAHQCKVCRKRFLRRPHCRRHVAQAHTQEIERVTLPKNWQSTVRRRFVFKKAPIQRVIEPVPPPPVPREEQYEPTPERPHQCEVCKKCFKRIQHLRRHKAAHLQIEIDRSEIMRGIQEQHKAQQQLQSLIGQPEVNGNENDNFDDDDVIALSDDDDDIGEEIVDGMANEMGDGRGDGMGDEMGDDMGDDIGDEEDMGEEISPEEFNGLGQFAAQSDNEVVKPVVQEQQPQLAPVQKQPRLSDIPHLFYNSDDDDDSDNYTKYGMPRQRAPPMPKMPGERPYLCKQCNKTFKRSDHLKSHLKTHREETDFNCEYCQKGFRYRQNYLIHMKNKTCLNQGDRFRGHTMTENSSTKKIVGNGAEIVLGD